MTPARSAAHTSAYQGHVRGQADQQLHGTHPTKPPRQQSVCSCVRACARNNRPGPVWCCLVCSQVVRTSSSRLGNGVTTMRTAAAESVTLANVSGERQERERRGKLERVGVNVKPHTVGLGGCSGGCLRCSFEGGGGAVDRVCWTHTWWHCQWHCPQVAFDSLFPHT